MAPVALPEVIELVLAGPVVFREATNDDPVGPLPESLRHATPARRAEFTTTRRLAHEALQELDLDDGPLLIGPDRAPLWPTGAVGSLTHCEGYRAAAVARQGDVAGLGIDAEPHQPLPAEALDVVCSSAERESWRAACGPGVAAERLLFSAKESVFKAWYPLVGVWFDFADAEVLAQPDGTFAATATPPGLGRTVRCRGRWAATASHVVTAVVLNSGCATR